MSGIFGGGLGRLAKWAIGLGAAGSAVQASIYTVGPGHRGFLFDRVVGIRETIYGEGTHFYIPFLQYPIVMDVRTRPRVIRTVTGTKDLQTVNLALRILSRPKETKIKTVYQQLGLDYDDRILPSLGNEVLKAVVAQYNADQLLTLREKVSNEIRSALTRRARDFNLVLEDISITDLAFSRDFAAAIEHKQVAQQNAERAKFVVMKAEQEKKALIIQSEGDAEAARLVSNAIEESGKALIEIRRIETAMTVASLLAHNPNVTYLPSQGNMLLQVSGAKSASR